MKISFYSPLWHSTDQRSLHIRCMASSRSWKTIFISDQLGRRLHRLPAWNNTNSTGSENLLSSSCCASLKCNCMSSYYDIVMSAEPNRPCHPEPASSWVNYTQIQQSYLQRVTKWVRIYSHSNINCYLLNLLSSQFSFYCLHTMFIHWISSSLTRSLPTSTFNREVMCRFLAVHTDDIIANDKNKVTQVKARMRRLFCCSSECCLLLVTFTHPRPESLHVLNKVNVKHIFPSQLNNW